MSPFRSLVAKTQAWAAAKHALEDHVKATILSGAKPDIARQAELAAALNQAEQDLESAARQEA